MMSEKEDSVGDTLMRSDTVAEIPADDIVACVLYPDDNYYSQVLNFVRKHKRYFHILLAILCFILTFVLVLLLGSETSFNRKLRLIRNALSKGNFNAYPTIKEVENEDHAYILALAVHKGVDGFNPVEEAEIYLEFNEFNRLYNKVHSSISEKAHKFLVFRANKHRINLHNINKNKSFTMEMNHLGDVAMEEFMSRLNLGNAQDVSKAFEDLNDSKYSLPPVIDNCEIDYRRDGWLTPVKDQGNCGSCWAFATIGVIESFIKRHTGRIVSLSEQQLVDCVKECNGCSGGNPYFAFDYAKQKGLMASYLYRYNGTDGKCMEKGSVDSAKIKEFVYTEDNTDIAGTLKEHGPLTSCVAVNENWQFYRSGTIDSCGASINHAIVIAGMGNDEHGPYWLIKNCWGTFWGNEGYAKIRRSNEPGYENCGLNKMTVYVTDK